MLNEKVITWAKENKENNRVKYVQVIYTCHSRDSTQGSCSTYHRIQTW